MHFVILKNRVGSTGRDLFVNAEPPSRTSLRLSAEKIDASAVGLRFSSDWTATEEPSPKASKKPRGGKRGGK